MALAQQRREDVLADPFSPQVIAAIAAGMRRGVEIHPVLVFAAGHAVAAVGDSLAA